MRRKILVTGVAGFIGMHCAQRLLARGWSETSLRKLLGENALRVITEVCG